MPGTLVFNAASFAAYPFKQRNLITAIEGSHASTLADGTTIDTDSEGKIYQAQYASGIKVKRNANYCMVQSPDGGFWYGDRMGRWFPLD